MIEKTVWVISVRAGNQRRDFEFRTKEGESPQDTYRRVKKNASNIQSQLPPTVVVEIISHSMAFKPKGKTPHKNWYWCPYCNKWRVFNYDERLDINRCSICGVSDQDFYVRKYNNLWRSEIVLGKKVKK